NILLAMQNEQIRQQKEEIQAQRDLAAQQRDLIMEQKQEITDSIRYAYRIQTAAIPSSETLNEIVSDHFIMYKPRDIVSGDFYWIGRHEKSLIILAADCTGHGVPGAFMSMLGIAFLNEIVNKESITSPALILNKLRENIIRALQQKGMEGEQKDGMDVAVVTINPDLETIEFAGANNPLYLIRNQELIEKKGSKMPVAIHEIMDYYENHVIPIEKNDTLYIFSDGFPDQFGGPQGKKFKYKPFKELLISIQDNPMTEQEQILIETFENWRADYEQIDDVLVIGIKI
ncbi:MAG: SpoIIE family protein phosphatase, partial [Bacteroidota bacterium]